MVRVSAAVDKQLKTIHPYATKDDTAPGFKKFPPVISAYPATTLDRTISAKEINIGLVTAGPFMRDLSLYAIKMMVKFLKIVNTGMERYWIAFDPE